MAAPDPSSILDQPSRRKIYAHLLRLPGDHFGSIVRSLGISSGAARHHLETLVRFGLVTADRTAGRCRYYAKETAETNSIFRQHWRYRDLRFRVLLAARGQDRPGPAQIARAMGISRQLAAYHLRELEKAGKVRAGRHPTRRR